MQEAILLRILLGSFIFLLLLLQGTQGSSGSQGRVVYGNDDRNEPASLSDAKSQKIASASVALIKKTMLEFKSSTQTYEPTVISTLTKVGGLPLCTNVKYYNQPDLAYCSAALVSNNGDPLKDGDPLVILTAGHCIPSQSECEKIYFVFDFKNPSTTAPYSTGKFPEKDVYVCDRIIDVQAVQMGVDYAVVRIKPVNADSAGSGASNRVPMNFLSNAVPSVGESLAIAGFPLGIPLKISRGGVVKYVNTTDGFWLLANVDSFSGNSGGMIVRDDDNVIVALISRGNADVIQSSTNSDCWEYNVCSDTDGCAGKSFELAYTTIAFEQVLPGYSGIETMPLGSQHTYIMYPGIFQSDANIPSLEPGMSGTKSYNPFVFPVSIHNSKSTSMNVQSALSASSQASSTPLFILEAPPGSSQPTVPIKPVSTYSFTLQSLQSKKLWLAANFTSWENSDNGKYSPVTLKVTDNDSSRSRYMQYGYSAAAWICNTNKTYTAFMSNFTFRGDTFTCLGKESLYKSTATFVFVPLIDGLIKVTTCGLTIQSTVLSISEILNDYSIANLSCAGSGTCSTTQSEIRDYQVYANKTYVIHASYLDYQEITSEPSFFENQSASGTSTSSGDVPMSLYIYSSTPGMKFVCSAASQTDSSNPTTNNPTTTTSVSPTPSGEVSSIAVTVLSAEQGKQAVTFTLLKTTESKFAEVVEDFKKILSSQLNVQLSSAKRRRNFEEAAAGLPRVTKDGLGTVLIESEYVPSFGKDSGLTRRLFYNRRASSKQSRGSVVTAADIYIFSVVSSLSGDLIVTLAIEAVNTQSGDRFVVSAESQVVRALNSIQNQVATTLGIALESVSATPKQPSSATSNKQITMTYIAACLIIALSIA
eukprot:Nk52_evm85s230 gene=Nk52_evmTU85s230